MKAIIHNLLLAAGFLLLFFACKKPQYGSMSVSLKDNPANYQEVNVDLQKLEILLENSGTSCWHELSVNKGVYDLLLLQDSPMLLATQTKIPLGKVTKIKITLGMNNTVKENNTYYPLRLPYARGKTYSVTIPADYMITPNSVSDVLIDFDALKSVAKTKNNAFILNPVIISGTESIALSLYDSLF
jgi:hypothetical protein